MPNSANDTMNMPEIISIVRIALFSILLVIATACLISSKKIGGHLAFEHALPRVIRFAGLIFAGYAVMCFVSLQTVGATPKVDIRDAVRMYLGGGCCVLLAIVAFTWKRSKK